MLRISLLGMLRAGRGLLSLLSQFPSCATSAPGWYLWLSSRVVLTCVRIKVRFGGPELLLLGRTKRYVSTTAPGGTLAASSFSWFERINQKRMVPEAIVEWPSHRFSALNS